MFFFLTQVVGCNLWSNSIASTQPIIFVYPLPWSCPYKCDVMSSCILIIPMAEGEFHPKSRYGGGGVVGGYSVQKILQGVVCEAAWYMNDPWQKTLNLVYEWVDLSKFCPKLGRLVYKWVTFFLKNWYLYRSISHFEAERPYQNQTWVPPRVLSIQEFIEDLCKINSPPFNLFHIFFYSTLYENQFGFCRLHWQESLREWIIVEILPFYGRYIQVFPQYILQFQFSVYWGYVLHTTRITSIKQLP